MFIMEDKLKEALVNDLMVPICYSKKYLDTEDIMNNRLTNAIITENIEDSYKSLSNILTLKITNSDYKRKLLNFDEDTIKNLLQYILNYDKTEYKIDLKVLFKYNNKEIEYTIVILHNEYVKVGVRVNEKYISVSNELTIDGKLIVTFNFKILDSTYTNSKFVINFGHDPFYYDKDAFTEAYIMSSENNLVMQDLINMESILCDIYSIREDKFKEEVLINCIKRLTDYFKKCFSIKKDLFNHSLLINNDTINLFLTYNMSIEKYSLYSGDKEKILPLVVVDDILYFLNLYIDDTTVIDGSYAIELLGIKKENMDSFNRYMEILKERTQETITRSNCKYGFEKFIEYTKAKSLKNYVSYSGRCNLELYSYEIANWLDKAKDILGKNVEDVVLQQHFINRVKDPWTKY